MSSFTLSFFFFLLSQGAATSHGAQWSIGTPGLHGLEAARGGGNVLPLDFCPEMGVGANQTRLGSDSIGGSNIPTIYSLIL